MRLKMDEFKFKSLEELYKKLIPAFNVRVNDLKRSKINGITREDISWFIEDFKAEPICVEWNDLSIYKRL